MKNVFHILLFCLLIKFCSKVRNKWRKVIKFDQVSYLSATNKSMMINLWTFLTESAETVLYCDKYCDWEIKFFISGYEMFSHITRPQLHRVSRWKHSHHCRQRKLCPKKILQCLVSNTPQHQNIVDVINLQSLTYIVAHHHSYLSDLMPSGTWPLGEQQACRSEGRLCVGEPARGTAGLRRATKSNA